LGVLLVRRIYPFSAELAGSSVTELRSLLDTAMSVLLDLDWGNKIVLWCRNTLLQLLVEFDKNGSRGICKPLSQSSFGAGLLTLAIYNIDLEIGPASGPFSLSPTSAWAWRLTDPGLLAPDLPLGLVHGLSAGSLTSQLPGGLEMPPDS